MVKIAFFDVDGTLVELGKPILSGNTRYCLNKLKENGVLICMATGRGVLALPDLGDMEFDVYLTFNGSYCYNSKEVIYTNPLDSEDVQRIISNVKKMGRPVAITNEKFLVTSGTSEDLKKYFQMGDVNMRIADNFDELSKEPIIQMMVDCVEAEHATILAGTKSAKAVAWWEKAADIIPASGGKGVAVEKILEYYGFDKSEAIAFGDGNNDIDMLKAVGTGIAMANATEKVKQAADVVCLSAVEEGVYHYCLERGLL